MDDLIKKFVQGLIFGLGFSVSLFIMLVLFTILFVDRVPNEFSGVINTPVNTINEPPAIQEQYLGSAGVFSAHMPDEETVLTAGPGEIQGVVIGDGERIEGLRLRLGLNGAVMSQWATTNAEGEYSIAVPYGEYEISGFELEHKTADNVLPGLIGSPRNQHVSNRFVVAKNKPGEGLQLKFVKPVEKHIEKSVYSLEDQIKLAWAPYPGASQYRVQVYQKSDIDDYFGNETIF